MYLSKKSTILAAKLGISWWLKRPVRTTIGVWVCVETDSFFLNSFCFWELVVPSPPAGSVFCFNVYKKDESGFQKILHETKSYL